MYMNIRPSLGKSIFPYSRDSELKRLDHNIDCVGSVKLGQVPHAAIAEVMANRPHLARLFWFSIWGTIFRSRK